MSRDSSGEENQHGETQFLFSTAVLQDSFQLPAIIETENVSDSSILNYSNNSIDSFFSCDFNKTSVNLSNAAPNTICNKYCTLNNYCSDSCSLLLKSEKNIVTVDKHVNIDLNCSYPEQEVFSSER